MMEFNVTKCNSMSITNKRTPIEFEYQLHGHTLEKVTSAKYLGIEITNNLKWNKHISHISAKANRTSSFIYRNLKGCSINTQTQCFKTFVRPLLEYASIVWDPHYKKDIDILEKTQRRAARRFVNDFSKSTSASHLTQTLGLETLQTRRKRNKATTIFKIYHNKLAVKLPDSIRPSTRSTRGHNNKLIIPTTRTNSHMHSFFLSGVRLWNDLPADATESGHLDTFERILSVVLTDKKRE